MSQNWIRTVSPHKEARNLVARGQPSQVGSMLLALCIGVGVIQAADIPIPNGSFESPTPPPGFPATPMVDSWQKSPQPVWFDPDAFGGITWDQLSGVFPNTPVGSPDHIVNLDGDQAAYMFALPEVALFQELELTYEVGLSYTLTVGMLGTQGIVEGSSFELSLYYLDGVNGPVTLAATPVTYTAEGFPTVTQLIDVSASLSEVQADDPWAGQNIGIQFLSTSGEAGVWDLDNVRLQAIPEPGTMGLLALGLGVWVMAQHCARRRRAAVGGRDA